MRFQHLRRPRLPPPVEDWNTTIQSSHLTTEPRGNLASSQRAAFRFFETYHGLALVFLDSLPNPLHVSEQQGTGRIMISIWLLRPLRLICTGFEIERLLFLLLGFWSRFQVPTLFSPFSFSSFLFPGWGWGRRAPK